MFGTKRIALPVVLFDQAVASAQTGGYASVEELVKHAVEREIERLRRLAVTAADRADTTEDEAKVIKRLEGLGYFG